MKNSRRYLFFACHNYCFSILRPLQDAIRARGDEVSWFILGDRINPQYLTDDEQRCLTVDEVMAYQPLAVFTPNNVVPHFFPGIKVQVFHGFNARKRSDDDHFGLRGFFDLYCTHGPCTTEVFQQLAEKKGYFKVVETGWPKVDYLLSGSEKERKPSKPTVILTSTFSKNLTCAPHLYSTIERLVKKNSMQWLVQFHPEMDSSIVQMYKAIKAENYQFIETSDVIPYLRLADVMVCDTSSILQEFMQLERPVVTFKNRTPGPWLIDVDKPDDLEQAIERALLRPEKLMSEIRRYNANLHPYSDGQSSVRVLDAADKFIASKPRALRRKPLNILRKIKICRQLNYWRL